MQTYPLGQLRGCDGEPGLVSAWVGDHSQAIKQTEGLQDGGVDPNAHGVVAGFDAPKRRTAGKGAFGDNFGRQAAPPAGITDIEPELAQGLANRNGRAVR